ncbi:MAG: lipid-binding SYLF domain-containing protein [Thermodesulfobacteriota bacterium]
MKTMLKTMKRFARRIAVQTLLSTLALLPAVPAPVLAADDAMEANQLVDNARMTLQEFLAAPEMDALRDLLKRAEGVFIAPQVLKGAFILGVSGGSGVMVTRTGHSATWNGPAFYTIGELSYGLQAGGEASQVVLLAMTERGVTAFLSDNLKLGADIGVAAGPVGMGAAAATANLSADIISFSRSKGAFGGVALNGAVVAVRDGLNRAYYGKPASPTEILVRNTVDNSQAAGLLKAIGTGAGRP